MGMSQNCTRRHDRIMAVDDVQGDLQDAIGAALARNLTSQNRHLGAE